MEETKKKKSIFKRWYTWVAALVVIIMIAASGGSSSSGSSGLTLEKYNQVKTGMSKAEVVTLFGSEGKVASEAEGIQMISWESGSFGANALITFQNGVVQSKAQAGL
jgi:hypothetical protein